ncbi:MAG: hypothetical protein LC650_03385, partial [Actinobacteria bacterium]|nr:hypothetical protein [Actinomycetota bacterium]
STVDVVPGAREGLSLAMELQAVRPDTWVRFDVTQRDALVAISESTVTFEDPPEVIQELAEGDILYLPPEALEGVSGSGLLEPAQADEGTQCTVQDEGSYFLILGRTVLGRETSFEYVPAGIADLFSYVVDMTASCTLSGSLSVPLPSPVGDFTSLSLVVDRLSVEVALTGREEVGMNPFLPSVDFQPMVLKSAACLGGDLCSRWFVFEEFTIDMDASSMGFEAALSPSASEGFAASNKLVQFSVGPTPIFVNVGVDLIAELGATLLELAYGGPLTWNAAYANLIGDESEGEWDYNSGFQWDPTLNPLTPDLESGDALNASVSLTTALFVGVSDPVRIGEAYARGGARTTATIGINDAYSVADAYPYSIDANSIVGVGVRYRFGGRFNEVWNPTFTFEPPFYTFANAKLAFTIPEAADGAYAID